MNKWVVFFGLLYIFMIAVDFFVDPEKYYGIGYLWHLAFGDYQRDLLFGGILVLLGLLWPSPRDD